MENIELIRLIYDTFDARYGNLNWWPARTPYEVILGAVLTQNTAWSNVEKALANFELPPEPKQIENMPIEVLIDHIRPAGFFNVKAAYIKNVTSWYKQYGYSVDAVKSRPLTDLRAELLAVRGVGKETADSILLYAFGFPTFVVDAYTRRLLKRVGIDVKRDYDVIKSLFETSIETDSFLYNNYHAAIVINAKEHCRKQPICAECPLYKGICNYAC